MGACIRAPPPLLLLVLDNLVLQQTDEKWNVVELSEARRFNRNRADNYVFRQLNASLTAVLVPWDENGPAAMLLKGARRMWARVPPPDGGAGTAS